MTKKATFKAHALLQNSHLQTLWPALLRPLPILEIRRERLELPDGDFVDLGWSGAVATGAPLAVLVHGLTGSFDSKYLRGTAQKLVALGWRTVMLQLRGAGPEPNRLRKSYHQGDTADLRYLLQLLRAREPDTFLAVVGWSLGGNITLKAMGEEGDRAPVNCAAASSVPFRLRPCVDVLRQGFARNYQNKMLRELKVQMWRKHAVVAAPAEINLQLADAAQDFIEWDNAYTAPLNGFADAEDYYARSECAPFIPEIRRPTLIVHSVDDPFMDPTITPNAEALAPQVALELTPRGGHVGFVASGRWGQPVYWLEHRLVDFLQSELQKR
ncbi:hydrolase [Stenotrophobium rhamnosiphilum]|uniref:Hydrolase n=1 Tax=Stenotrophobium rhamnosiphilum TaxID=2029166 RepID=A0A2T5MBW6_9GAMM|nr:hydrolase [Stenotrophobium rhamnosiphilum]PTU30050.1 hydrolase [Stenotrophobium rhamnosiphilum]